jgi:hypothetical protein
MCALIEICARFSLSSLSFGYYYRVAPPRGWGAGGPHELQTSRGRKCGGTYIAITVVYDQSLRGAPCKAATHRMCTTGAKQGQMCSLLSPEPFHRQCVTLVAGHCSSPTAPPTKAGY